MVLSLSVVGCWLTKMWCCCVLWFGYGGCYEFCSTAAYECAQSCIFRVLWQSLTPQFQASFTPSIKDVNTSDWQDGVLLSILICHRAFPDQTDYIRVSKEHLVNLTLQSNHINFIEAYNVVMRCLPTTEADWTTYVLAYFEQVASSSHKNTHVRSWASYHRTQYPVGLH